MASIVINKDNYTTQVIKALEHEIETGALPPLCKLKSTRELANRFAVSKNVIMRALDVLEERRLIHREERRGVFVSEMASNPNILEVLVFVFGVNPAKNSFVSLILSVLSSEAAAGKINFYTRFVTLDEQKMLSDEYVYKQLDAEVAKLSHMFHSDCVMVIYPGIKKRELKKCIDLPFPCLFIGNFQEGDYPDISYNRLGFVPNYFDAGLDFAKEKKMSEVILIAPDVLAGQAYFRDALARMHKKAKKSGIHVSCIMEQNSRHPDISLQLAGLEDAAAEIAKSGFSEGVLYATCTLHKEYFLQALARRGITPKNGKVAFIVEGAERYDAWGSGIYYQNILEEEVDCFNQYLCHKLHKLADGELNDYQEDYLFHSKIKGGY